MSSIPFSMRLRPEVARKLELLSKATHRPRANVIAWLILKTPIPIDENNQIKTSPKPTSEGESPNE